VSDVEVAFPSRGRARARADYGTGGLPGGGFLLRRGFMGRVLGRV
jgi:hypothetical protein